jgi:hypothetical protein
MGFPLAFGFFLSRFFKSPISNTFIPSVTSVTSYRDGDTNVPGRRYERPARHF